HGNRGAVDDLDAAAQPKLVLQDMAFQALAEVLVNAEQSLVGQATSGLAISAGVLGEFLLVAQLPPSLDFTHRLPASSIGRKHLEQKSPESDQVTEAPQAT